jgi:hypothetical protein
MSNIFFIAAFISIIFLIIKFIEMRFIDKESKPLKLLIRDALLVFFSIVFGNFILDQLEPIISETSEFTNSNPSVFTDNPGF